jgi:IMP and pyridine-specific 5'-nucleotidase
MREQLGPDYKLHPVKEHGPGGWKTATKFIQDTPGNWNEDEIQSLLDIAETTIIKSMKELRLRGSILRKKRAVGLYPKPNQLIPREALDETVLRVHEMLNQHESVKLPFCAFNGGSDVWVDVGNKRVGVEMLAAYLGIAPDRIIHVGDQFLNTGNDHAARGVCPCIWITNPDETTYILKSILRLAGVPLDTFPEDSNRDEQNEGDGEEDDEEDCGHSKVMNFTTFCQRASMTNLDGLAALSLANGV